MKCLLCGAKGHHARARQCPKRGAFAPSRIPTSHFDQELTPLPEASPSIRTAKGKGKARAITTPSANSFEALAELAGSGPDDVNDEPFIQVPIKSKRITAPKPARPSYKGKAPANTVPTGTAALALEGKKSTGFEILAKNAGIDISMADDDCEAPEAGDTFGKRVRNTQLPDLEEENARKAQELMDEADAMHVALSLETVPPTPPFDPSVLQHMTDMVESVARTVEFHEARVRQPTYLTTMLADGGEPARNALQGVVDRDWNRDAHQPGSSNTIPDTTFAGGIRHHQHGHMSHIVGPTITFLPEPSSDHVNPPHDNV